MAPKRAGGRGRGRGVVKREVKQEREEPCVGGLAGKDLSNAVTVKLRKAPQHVRDFYDGVKFDKIGHSQSKREFVEQLLSSSSWNTDYFQRLRAVEKTSEDRTKLTWMSWKQLMQHEEPEVVSVMLEQGKLVQRPHRMLQHDAESTAGLPEHLCYEYAYMQDSTEQRASASERMEASDVTMPSREAEDEEVLPKSQDDVVERTKKEVERIKAFAKKTLNQFNTNELDFTMRLAKYDSNEYLGTL